MGEPVEIPLKYKYRQQQASGRQKSSANGNSGTNKHRGEIRKDVRDLAHAVTVANRPTLNIGPDGKRRWIRPV